MLTTTRDTLTQALRDYYQDNMNRNPVQRANTAVYNQNCANAKLARMRRTFTNRLGVKFARGEWVLTWESVTAYGTYHSLWKPGCRCPTVLSESDLNTYLEVAP